MPGLPFQSMPAATFGTPKLLGNLQTGQEETVYPSQLGRMDVSDLKTRLLEPTYNEADYRRERDPMRRPVVEMAPAPSQAQGPGVDTDPFSTIDELEQAGTQPIVAAFDSQRTAVRGLIQQKLDAERRQYDIEIGYAGDPEAKEKINRKYALITDKLRSDADPELKNIELQQSEAVSKVQAGVAATRIEMQTYQRLIEEGVITPEEGKRRQFAAMGMAYTPKEEKQQTPLQYLGELRQYRSALEDSVVLYKRVNAKGQYEEYNEDIKVWELAAASPEQIASVEEAHRIYAGVNAAIGQLATSMGRKMGLGEAGRQAIPAPAKKSGWAKIGDLIKTSPTGLSASGAWYPRQNPAPKPVATNAQFATTDVIDKARTMGATPQDIAELTTILNSGDQNRIRVALARLER